MEEYLGEVVAFGFQFAPRGWLKCDGAEYKIKDYPKLFEVIGIRYGGDAKNTFKVPDYRGRVLVQEGKADGLVPGKVGETTGSETEELGRYMYPPHTHSGELDGMKGKFNCSSSDAKSADPSDNSLARLGRVDLYSSEEPNAEMMSGLLATDDGVEIADAGKGLGHYNMQPGLAVNYCICALGLYPSATEEGGE